MKHKPIILRRIFTMLLITGFLFPLSGNKAQAVEESSRRETLYDLVEKYVEEDESAPLHYAGHSVSQDTVVHLNWVFDLPKEKVGDKEKMALLKQLGLEEEPIMVLPRDYTLARLDGIVSLLDKVIANADAPVHGIVGYGTYIHINRVQVTLARPFEENRKAFVKNLGDADALVFWIAGTETGVDPMDIPSLADRLPLPVFRAGARIDFSWEKKDEAARYRCDVVDWADQKTIKSVYTKNGEGFLSAELAQKGTYKITVRALDDGSAPMGSYATFIHVDKVAFLPKGEIDLPSFSFAKEGQIGYAVGGKTAASFLPYYDGGGKVVFLPEEV